MTYSARVVADSVSNVQGLAPARLTTLEVTFPRFVLAEFNTHRVFSRNSASSRAILVEKRIRDVRANPFVPEAFAANKRGMQAGEALEVTEQYRAEQSWIAAAARACDAAEELAALGVHKQWANRLIEPFAWHTVVVTSTEWTNFWNLRISSLAQPEIRRAAELMLEAYDASTPRGVGLGGWHLPYVDADDVAALAAFETYSDRGVARALVSSARCARVSYLTHDGRRDVEEDLALADRLLTSRHMSPFEHAAFVDEAFVNPMRATTPIASNFAAPWTQYRKLIRDEAVAPKELA